MERRANKRKHSKVEARFPCLGTFFSGTVTNLSEKNMFLKTAMCVPDGSQLEILICSQKEILKIPARVVRKEKTNNTYKGMGLELLNLSKGYLELLIKLNLRACNSQTFKVE
jgi:hypothetical protein